MEQVRHIYQSEGEFTFENFDEKAWLEFGITLLCLRLTPRVCIHILNSSRNCQPNKSKWFAKLWTGTRRISRSHFIDDFGKKLTESEFSEKIGTKALV